MLGWIFSLAKWTIFALVILVMGHVIEWRNRTISDHIKTTLSHFDLEQPRALERMQRLARERISKEERARLDRILSGQTRN